MVTITKSLSENSVGSCGEGFWLWPRRRGRSIPAAGCNDRANAGQRQKTRRPEGFRGKGRLASLLLGHRHSRVCSLVAPRQPAFSAKTGLPRNFKTGFKKITLVSLVGAHSRDVGKIPTIRHPPKCFALFSRLLVPFRLEADLSQMRRS